MLIARTRVVISLAAATALVVAACGGDDDADPVGDTADTEQTADTAANDEADPTEAPDDTDAPDTDAPDATADSGDEPPAADGEIDPDGVLKVGMNFLRNQSYTFDATTSITDDHNLYYNMLYAPLVKLDSATQEYTPYLAESYEVLDDSSMQFTLRADATFHDGRPVTSADAKYSIETTRDNQASGASNVNADVQLVDEVEIVDDRTFIVHMTRPALLSLHDLMISVEFMIVPADAGAEQATNPIGNGPFRFVSHQDAVSLTLEKYPEFFDADAIQLAGIEFYNLTEGATQLNALLAGDVDVAVRLDVQSFEAVTERDGFQAISTTDDTNFLFVNLCKAPGYYWEDARLRQAAFHATDREQFAEVVYGGYGAPMAQLWPVGHPNYNEEVGDMYEHDPARAQELVDEVGVEGGDGIWATSAIPEAGDAALLLGQMWGEVGIPLEVLQTDDLVGDALSPSMSEPPTLERGHSILITNTSPSIVRATRLFRPHITNTCTYSNDRIDELLDEISALAPDDSAATERWHEIAEIMQADMPFLVLAQTPGFLAVNDRIGGVEQDHFQPMKQGAYEFDQWYVKSS